MITRVQNWGNSLACRIPKALAEEIGLVNDTPVDIRLVDGEIRIKPKRKKRYDLDELLASVPEGGLQEEWSTGPPVGNEVL